jgi:hypothetical protein
VVALNQFRALAGEHGLEPLGKFVRAVSFRDAPSLLYLAPRDWFAALLAWLGIALSVVALMGWSSRGGAAFSMLLWAAIWILYLSFVNTGQTFYGFGWESILLEGCFLAMFLGARTTVPQAIPLWLTRWLLFRIMFGAGLIKLRGDECWKKLTCLDWHYETQPMPNPLSWLLHWGPEWSHKAGVLFNHFAELIVPFGYFLPQPVASIAGIITIVFQASIMASGNLSWLNLLTLVLAIPTIDDRVWAKLLPLQTPELVPPLKTELVAQYAVAAITVVLSFPVIANMVSSRQAMNRNFNPFHLVGTYGAFGSVTRPRYEVIVEGTEQIAPSETSWQAYEFKGKPGRLDRLPPQVAPYHLRLDWLMWFAAMGNYYNNPWFLRFMDKLLEADPPTLALLKSEPFGGRRPRMVRANLYEYEFTTPEERKTSGNWWKRRYAGVYLPPVSLDSAQWQNLMRALDQ